MTRGRVFQRGEVGEDVGRLRLQRRNSVLGIRLLLCESFAPIRTDAQRKLLGRVWQLAGKGSLIPAERSYIEHLRVYVRQIMNAGLSKMHGLRHAYAQQRYFELTGWVCPIAGGPISKSLSPNDRRIDQTARLTISRELGHVREEILSIYIGR